jgi:hypothetical protein
MAMSDKQREQIALLESERDAAIEHGEQVERERDALLEIVGEKKAGAMARLLKHSTKLVQIERDDARVERDRLRAVVQDIADHDQVRARSGGELSREQSERIRRLGIEFAAEQAAYALNVRNQDATDRTAARHKLEHRRDEFFAAVLEVTNA